MAFDGTELRLGNAPRGLCQPAALGVLNVSQADQPALGRNEQAGRFLSRGQVEDDAAYHALRLAIAMAAPDARQATDFQGEVQQTILEILDAREVGKPAAVSQGDTHGG